MIVADSTAVTALTLAGCVEVVGRLFGKVIISTTAAREMNEVLAALDPDCRPPEAKDIDPVAIDVPLTAMSMSESESIELCRQVKSRLLISDDPVVRAEAAKERIACIGTLGILYAARSRGIIQDIETPLERLRRLGWFISPECEQLLLSRAGG